MERIHPELGDTERTWHAGLTEWNWYTRQLHWTGVLNKTELTDTPYLGPTGIYLEDLGKKKIPCCITLHMHAFYLAEWHVMRWLHQMSEPHLFCSTLSYPCNPTVEEWPWKTLVNTSHLVSASAYWLKNGICVIAFPTLYPKIALFITVEGWGYKVRTVKRFR